MFKLTIEDDEGKTTVVPIARDEMTIGRLEGNTIRLTERNVSRRHARLVRQNGAMYIEDLQSYTGVRVNGTKIAELTPLRDGDEVQIGDYRIALRGERPVAISQGDRPTMPTLPTVSGPMATVGGSVAIPTRASVAAMTAQPQQLVSNTPTAPIPVVAAPALAVEPAPAPVPAPIPVPMPVIAATAPPAPVAPPPSAVATVAAVTPPPALGPVAPFPPAIPRKNGPAVSVGVPGSAEAQPTIPVRALADAADGAADAVTGPAARMVVLTTELAGKELALDRPSLVIGRTEENDLVLAHRSISRHHAKIVRDGGSYTIVDLQSANGVRVNGEDYERIELHAGDVIELGHVKLRFVGPLETYVYNPLARGGWRKPVKIVIAAGALVSVAVVAAAIYRDGRRAALAPAGAPVAAAAPPATAVAPTPAAAAADPARQQAGPPAAEVAKPGAAATLAEAKQAVAAEDWEKARTTLDRLGTAIDDAAIRKDAIALRKQVDTERQAAILFSQFDEASTEKNYAEAVSRYEQIPVDSVYKRRARSRYEESRALLIAELLASAEKARSAGRCADVRAAAVELGQIDPRNTLIKEMVRLCRPRPEPSPVAARPAKPRANPLLAAEGRTPEPARRIAPAAVEPKRAEAAERDSDGDADALMKQAREAWLRQQCGAAVDLSRKALHAKPGLSDAYQIIAVCSCTLKDVEAANRAYSKLDERNRHLVQTLCQKNGVSVGERE